MLLLQLKNLKNLIGIFRTIRNESKHLVREILTFQFVLYTINGDNSTIQSSSTAHFILITSDLFPTPRVLSFAKRERQPHSQNSDLEDDSSSRNHYKIRFFFFFLKKLVHKIKRNRFLFAN